MFGIFIKAVPLIRFFSFDLGEMFGEMLESFAKKNVEDNIGAFDAIKYFNDEQFRLAFEFKSFFNTTIQDMLNAIGNVTAYFALFLIILIFIKKGIACYILWTEGDPDVPPSQLVVRFMIAITTAVSIFLLYDVVLDVASELIRILDRITHISKPIGIAIMLTNLLSLNLLFSVFLLIAVIMVIISCFKLISDGLILTVIHWILPITCVGLLDNDMGIFAETWKAFIRVVSTVIIRYYFLQIGLYILYLSEGGLFFGSSALVSYILAIAVLGSSEKVANLLSQIFAPVQQGGGLMHKAYPAMMIGSSLKGLLRK